MARSVSYMEVNPNTDTEPYQPENARWMFPDAHAGKRPGSEPGIVMTSEGLTAIRSPIFRQNNPMASDQPQRQDTVAMIDGLDGVSTPAPSKSLIGMEAEFFVVDPWAGDILPTDGIGEDEFLTSQREVNSEARLRPRQAVGSLYKKLLSAEHELIRSKCGGLIDPASAVMHRAVDSKDVRWKNGYINRLVTVHPNLIGFGASGDHVHIDSSLETLMQMTNYLRPIVPYMNLPLQSAPFLLGERTPRLGEHYDCDELKPHDGRRVKSVRYLSRYACLDHGGVGIKQVHETLENALRAGEQRLMNGETHTPARMLGGHADVRLRPDALISDKNEPRRAVPARLEVCVFDSGAFRGETVAAVIDLLNAVVRTTERYIAEGEGVTDRMHQEFPQLYGKRYDTNDMMANLWRSEHNSREMAYDGFEATVYDAEGNETTARAMFSELIRLARSREEVGRDRLSTASLLTLRNAAIGQTTLRRVIKQVSGSNKPSLMGYYRTRYGTPADWMLALAETGDDTKQQWDSELRDRALSLQTNIGHYACHDVS